MRGTYSLFFQVMTFVIKPYICRIKSQFFPVYKLRVVTDCLSYLDLQRPRTIESFE